MLASQAQDHMTTDQASAAWAACNGAVRVGLTFADFLHAVITDNGYVARNGLQLVNAQDSPDGRENESRVKTYVTSATHEDVNARMERIRLLARLAARTSDEDMPKVERAMRAAMAALSNVDRNLWDVFASQGKQLLTGVDAGVLDIDGSAWTSSLKGRDASLRHTGYTGANRNSHQYVATNAYVSERDLI